MGKFIKDQLPDVLSYLDLQGLKVTGKGKWVTTECRLHGGSDSLRWNTNTGGFVCMACGAKGGDVLAYHMLANGMEFPEAAQELGAWDQSAAGNEVYKPKPLPAGAALEVLGFEALLVAVAAGNIANGVKLTATDKERLFLAARRIGTIQEAYQ